MNNMKNILSQLEEERENTAERVFENFDALIGIDVDEEDKEYLEDNSFNYNIGYIAGICKAKEIIEGFNDNTEEIRLADEIEVNEYCKKMSSIIQKGFSNYLFEFEFDRNSDYDFMHKIATGKTDYLIVAYSHYLRMLKNLFNKDNYKDLFAKICIRAVFIEDKLTDRYGKTLASKLIRNMGEIVS